MDSEGFFATSPDLLTAAILSRLIIQSLGRQLIAHFTTSNVVVVVYPMCFVVGTMLKHAIVVKYRDAGQALHFDLVRLGIEHMPSLMVPDIRGSSSNTVEVSADADGVEGVARDPAVQAPSGSAIPSWIFSAEFGPRIPRIYRESTATMNFHMFLFSGSRRHSCNESRSFNSCDFESFDHSIAWLTAYCTFHDK